MRSIWSSLLLSALVFSLPGDGVAHEPTPVGLEQGDCPAADHAEPFSAAPEVASPAAGSKPAARCKVGAPRPSTTQVALPRSAPAPELRTVPRASHHRISEQPQRANAPPRG